MKLRRYLVCEVAGLRRSHGSVCPVTRHCVVMEEEESSGSESDSLGDESGGVRAVARCVCGRNSLQFVSSDARSRAPLFHLECACCDCRQAREYEASRGGPTSASALSRVFYFNNDVLPPADTSALELTQLRDDAHSTRLLTTCCRSTLAVVHPAYRSSVVMVPADSCVLEASSSAPIARIYMGDYDTAHDGEPPPASCPTLGKDATDEDKEIYRCKFRDAAVPLPRAGIPIEELFTKLGSPRVLGLQKAQRFAAKAASQ